MKDVVQRDIQCIHNPSRSRIAAFAQRTFALINYTLYASNDRPPTEAFFQAKVEPTAEDLVRIHVERPHEPRQALGWAALQLYGELLTGASQVDLFEVSDSSKLSDDRLALWQSNRDISRIVRALRSDDVTDSCPPPLITFGPALHGEGMDIAVFNDADAPCSLPALLQTIRTAYTSMYHDDPASSALAAGIVGADSMEGLADAWGQAHAQAAHEGLVSAVGTFVAHDTFKATLGTQAQLSPIQDT